MEQNSRNVVYVIGHRNPDTDSICSAVAYAHLKHKATGYNYEPRRAGEISSETAYVLDYFKVEAPPYVKNVRTQVGDVAYRHIEGVSGQISLKKVWEFMRSSKANTVPVVDSYNNLEGLITMGDITRSYMEVYDNRIVSTAHTPYRNIIETLEGEMITGDENDVMKEGKVLIAAANPDVMENYIKKNDLVILGNRYEAQLCAIEMDAQCIVVCDGAMVSYTITKLAESHGCKIIKTPYDTYTAARLMNQSMPVRFFMKTEELITFTEEDYIAEVRDIMAKTRYQYFPILDDESKFLGLISRRNFIDAKPKRLILVDHNERSQSVEGIEDVEVLEIIDHHRLGGIQTMSPVFFRNQPLGCTATIVYQMYQENGIEIEPEIAGLLCAAILSDTLVYRSPTCTPIDKAAAETLAEIAGIDVPSFASGMFAAGSSLANKTAEEIFHQDYKVFTSGHTSFAVGQINAMNENELDKIKTRVLEYMEESYSSHGVSMLFFMLTNILEESTDLLYYGEGARELVGNAFHLKDLSEEVRLPKVVSRKKQLIPALMMALRQEEKGN